MAHYLSLPQHALADDPAILIVPGLNNSNPKHWQSIWERKLPNATRVDLGSWSDPHRNQWVNRLNLAIHRAARPVILVAHSLGCLAAAWWAEFEQPEHGNPVVGALLVAPPDVDRPGIDARISRFGFAPRNPLPFPAFLAASENDPYCKQRTALKLARDWDCRFAYAGAIGHINAESSIGDWAFGRKLLDLLIGEHQRRVADSTPLPLPARSQPAYAFAA